MQKDERLQLVQKFIDDHDREYDFKMLYAKLEEEINIERAQDSDLRNNNYLNNLRQTKEKQAEEYLRVSKTRKPEAFRSFRSHFQQDVREGMR